MDIHFEEFYKLKRESKRRTDVLLGLIEYIMNEAQDGISVERLTGMLIGVRSEVLEIKDDWKKSQSRVDKDTENMFKEVKWGYASDIVADLKNQTYMDAYKEAYK